MPWARSSSRKARPSLLGMTTSEKMRSKFWDLARSRAFGGVVADSGFVTAKAECAGKGSQRVGFIVDDQQMRFLGHDIPHKSLVMLSE